MISIVLSASYLLFVDISEILNASIGKKMGSVWTEYDCILVGNCGNREWLC